MFSRRHSQITEIQYLLVTEHDPVFIPFLPPADIAPAALKFLQFLPKDILQLDNAVNYFENANRLRMDNPYRFSVLYLRSLQLYLENHTRNVVRLFMVNGSCKDIAAITETLKNNNRPLDYYFFYGKKIPLTDFNNVVSTPGAFLTSLFENHKQIMHLIGAPAHQFLPHVDIYEREFYEVPSFVPAFGNHHMLNCLIGNFSYQHELTASEDDAMTEIKNISTKAHQSPESFDRLNIVVRSAKKIDAFFLLMRSKKIIHPVHDSDPIFAPLILIAPYQNPDIPDVLKHKNYSTPQPEMEAFIKNLDFEQTRNYIHTGQDIRSKNIQMEMEITGRKLHYLDQIGTLHSSFTYSPVIRLPFQGRTLNDTLSPFRADEVHQYASEETRVMLNETINHFGVELASRTVSRDLEEKFLQENRQVVAISDMPFEWLNIQDIPIAFTHDIARMPETALHGLMALFVANEQFVYTVPRDILKKTLVIFGSDDMPFLPWRFQVMEMAETHGFKTAICLNVNEAVAAIKKYKPDFLIFDCHGGYDAENKTSYLMLGEEQLTGELIVKHDISAPLVFLCACNTAPTYGTNNTIANAFFETHSLSVTTTYLPIEITSSTTLYIRLLNNLLSASGQALHCNWLNFLSHVIRTSYISETIKRFEGSKSGRATKHEIMKKQALLFTRSMIFYERRKVFEELKDMIATINAETDSPAMTVIPEYLFYSNLGRSDLIRFEVYEDEFAKKNKRR